MVTRKPHRSEVPEIARDMYYQARSRCHTFRYKRKEWEDLTPEERSPFLMKAAKLKQSEDSSAQRRYRNRMSGHQPETQKEIEKGIKNPRKYV